MDAFQKKTHKVSRGYTYTYYLHPGDSSKPALLFQHGWPDNATMWRDIALPLRSLNHPIIIPDLLGYDGTSKPTDPKEYKWDVMTQDLIDILTHENISKFISIGHDWGSALASRMYNYHPDKVVGLCNLNVAYMPPSGDKFDLDAVNDMMEKHFGAPLLGYWYVFAADDGPQVMSENIERLYHAMHGTAATMETMFTRRNSMREFLTKGRAEDVELRPYAKDEKFKNAFFERMKRDGFEGPQCWYKVSERSLQAESDRNLPNERKKVNVPSLYIGCKDDAVCRPEMMVPAKQAGLLPHLEEAEIIDSAHWCPYEAPEEVVKRMEPWLKKHFS
ncbi:alpha/beta-hydrolase [Sporormia fimetaria CBS 119925]|uniref:Alpha/beta-hydrolase n=1 Tax=Sporormia fimetaria CBS 119925 TaxID=1340428 RepID=A0A6A6VJ70_9PLEO|nr:alpha/beta-hydrolase [Sporormia fimetaria CBS 119925]